MRASLALAAILTLTSCGREVEPTSLELGELMLEVFRDANFSNRTEERELQARLIQLTDEISALADIESLNDGRAVAPPTLTPEYLGGLPEPANEDGEPTDFDAQTPEAVAHRSHHDLAAFEQIIIDTNQNCIGSDSTKYGDRRFDEDPSCFIDGSCDRLTFRTLLRTESLIANVWIDAFGDFHRTTITIDDQDLDVIIGRNWTDRTWSSDRGNAHWRQRYVLEVWVPDPADTTKTLRLFIMWSEADTALTDTMYRTNVREGLDESLQNTDVFLDGDICDDRDKTAEDWQ